MEVKGPRGFARRLLALVISLLAVTAAGAQTAQERALGGAVGDGASTLLGLAVGAAELNPLGPVLAIGLKAAVLRGVEGLPDTERANAYATYAAVWGGAAANNLCVTAAVLTGGAFAPACVVLGVAWGVKTWRETEEERLFWEGCAMLRQYAEEPDLPCVFSPAALAEQKNEGEESTGKGLQQMPL